MDADGGGCKGWGIVCVVTDENDSRFEGLVLRIWARKLGVGRGEEGLDVACFICWGAAGSDFGGVDVQLRRDSSDGAVIVA